MGQIKEISIESRERCEFIRLDAEIERLVTESRVKEGVCYVFVPHTSAGIMINEGADPTVVQDIGTKLSKLVPREGPYKHADAEKNADSHIKATLTGSSVIVLIRDGKPVLGTWQSVFFCEFDGPRRRQVLIRISEA
jgi:secondary thiamine-phosphate synthase enzyme